MDYSIYEQFADWLNKQPYWLQDAVWRMYNNKQIDDKQIDVYVEMCINQVQNKKVTYKKMDNRAVCPSENKTCLIIKSIENIKNVNALAENAKLEFGEKGVSVIYGLNGAGKSGFMRIFKHVSSNPYADPIQTNVYKVDNGGKPICDFKLLIDNEEKTISYDLSSLTDDEYLNQCDVFDTRISGAYITSSNSVSYEPFVFSVLKELANVADRIEYAIKNKIKEINMEPISCPEILRDYEEAEWIEELSHETIIPPECLVWSEDDDNRIKELKSLLDNENVEKMIKNLQHQELQIRNVKEDLYKKNILNENKRNELKTVYDYYVESKRQYEAAELLFSENASDLDKKSISVDEWQKLWRLGKKYYEKCIHDVKGIEFAADGSICPLCLQEINGKQQIRFSSVDEYVNGNCSETFSEAKKKLKQCIDDMLIYNYSSDAINSMLNGIIDDQTLNELFLFYKLIENLKEIKDYDEKYNKIEDIKSLSVLEKIDNVHIELKDSISTLRGTLNIEKKTEMLKELRHLQYRNWVNKQHLMIKSVIESYKKIYELKTCLSLLKTNRITTESNFLAEALISEAYIDRFTKELKLLAPKLKVKIERVKSTKGKSPYKVVLDTDSSIRKNPQDVLSEGEQRIVALAAFFADATGREELTPIIIDDPISSLDYNYEENATKRIVELGKNRQIIVFTHRISLLVGISEKCENDGVDFIERHIRGTLNGKGVSDFEDVYHGKISAQLSGIQERIKETKKMDPYSREYYDSCSRLSQQLRICFERSVEDVLFQQMVKRFSRRIMTGKLMKLDQITSDDCKIIDSMMSKYSFEEHSQPEDSCLIAMDLDEVIEDIQNFKDWIRDYNKKMGK